MSNIPVTISYHKQRSSTGRVRAGKIHLRISSLVSRREQQRHIDQLVEKMMKQWERGEGCKKVSLSEVFEGIVKNVRTVGNVRNPSTPSPLRSRQALRAGVGSVSPGVLKLSTGVEYAVKVKKTQNTKCKIKKIGNILVVCQPVDQEFDVDVAEEALWRFLRKDQIAVLEQRLHSLREGWIEESFSQLKLKQVMSRWGSCDKRRGIIMLSVKLLLVEPKLLDYVCIHELAHLRFADHSDLFWDLVSRKMPDWKVQRKRLRNCE